MTTRAEAGAQWTGCIVGALTSDHYRSLLGSARDVEHWVLTLRDGGRRSRPRTLETVWGYLNEIQPIPLVWSSRHDHLREVTCNDILGAVELLHGSKRRHTVLRSLFRHCKKRGSIFADLAARILSATKPTA